MKEEYQNTKVWRTTLADLRQIYALTGEKMTVIVDRLVKAELNRLKKQADEKNKEKRQMSKQENTEFNKSAFEALQRIMSSPADDSTGDDMSVIDAIADDDFAKEVGITVEEIPAYIAKIRLNSAE